MKIENFPSLCACVHRRKNQFDNFILNSTNSYFFSFMHSLPPSLSLSFLLLFLTPFKYSFVVVVMIIVTAATSVTVGCLCMLENNANACTFLPLWSKRTRVAMEGEQCRTRERENKPISNNIKCQLHVRDDKHD
jgi:hypothetical protein